MYGTLLFDSNNVFQKKGFEHPKRYIRLLLKTLLFRRILDTCKIFHLNRNGNGFLLLLSMLFIQSGSYNIS